MSDSPSTDDRTARDDAGEKWLSGFVSLIGLWIAASPAASAVAESLLWNNVLIGAAVFLLAGYNFYRHTAGEPTSTGVMSLVALLGLWTVVAPFLFEWAIAGAFSLEALTVAGQGLFSSNAIAGLLIAILAGYIAYSGGREVPRGTAAET